ncbi:MAG: alpha/beta fold hydrolase [Pseudomonadota bacterium]
MRIVILLGVIALLGVVISLGPRVSLDLNSPLPTAVPDVADDDLTALASWLANSEAVFNDITPGAEKKLAWANPSEPVRTPWSLVYIHGFSATRQETHPLSEQIAAQLGANVYYARLAGHGRSGQALTDALATDWLDDTHAAYEIGQRIGERVIVIGVSTGATLATWLALQDNIDDLAALILVSPNFGLANRSATVLTKPWGLALAKALSGETRSFEPVNEGHKRYWTVSYGIAAAAQMMALVDAINAAPLERVTTPTLLVRSETDTVIDIAAADKTLGRLQNPLNATHIVTDATDPWGHVIAGDILSPESTPGITEAVIDFVNRLNGG